MGTGKFWNFNAAFYRTVFAPRGREGVRVYEPVRLFRYLSTYWGSGPTSARAFRPWVVLVPYHGGGGNGASGLEIFILGFEPGHAHLT